MKKVSLIVAIVVMVAMMMTCFAWAETKAPAKAADTKAPVKATEKKAEPAKPAVKTETPEAVFNAYVAALKAKNLDQAATYTVAAQQKEFKKLDKKTKDAVLAMAPMEPKVKNTVVKGDTATLTYEASGKDMTTGKVEKGNGTVTFKKEGGKWKIEKDVFNVTAKPAAKPAVKKPAAAPKKTTK